MDKEYLTKITNDLYRLTLLFPKKEPLRYKMRELADNILVNLFLILDGDSAKYQETVFEIKKDIGPLDSFFDIAKSQSWVVSEDISEIQEKYSVIREEIEKFSNNIEEKNIPIEKTLENQEIVLNFASLNIRQKKIIDLMKDKEKIQVREAQELLPQVTKRTLRRDLDALMKIGAIKRSGKANLTFYKLADKEI